MEVHIQSFGSYQNIEFDEILITNRQGVQIGFSNLGARINRWGIPNGAGQLEQLILGHQNATEAIESGSYYGATVGRVAGRIASGTFELDGTCYQLPCNQNGNHLHGGFNGLDIQRFDYDVIIHEDRVDVRFTYIDSAGNNGYPGKLTLVVTHSFNEQNEWEIAYEAYTDAPTLFNPTNHVYFNLNGNNRAPITNHNIQISASNYIPLLDNQTPIGHIKEVTNTVFDVRQGVLYETLLPCDNEEFHATRGFDHPFVLDKGNSIDAIIRCEATKRRIEMMTDRSMVVVYTHNYVTQPLDVWGHQIVQYAGVTLETQEVPDAVHHPNLGDIVLRPTDIYRSKTMYRLVQEL